MSGLVRVSTIRYNILQILMVHYGLIWFFHIIGPYSQGYNILGTCKGDLCFGNTLLGGMRADGGLFCM